MQKETREALVYARQIAERENISVTAVMLTCHPVESIEYLDELDAADRAIERATEVMPHWAKDLVADDDHYGSIEDPGLTW